MDLASVIVPVYNTGEYLRKCLDSLVGQTYPNIQIILVDDGSTDHSYAICREYAARFSQIEVIHKENGGVSSARNEGLKHVCGKYVFFVDSDDFILPEYIEHFMELEECDYVAAGYRVNSPDGKRVEFVEYTLTIDEFKADCRSSWERVPMVIVCGNRYLMRIIRENQLEFNDNCGCGEDVRFNARYFLHAKTMRVVHRSEYIYYQRENSAVHSFWPDRLQEEKDECMARQLVFGDNETFDWIKFMHWHTALEHFHKYRDHKKYPEYAEVAKRELKKTIQDPYFRTCINYIIRTGTKDMQIAAICLRIGSYRLYKIIMNVITRVRGNRDE